MKESIKTVLGIHNEREMGSYLSIHEDISGSKCKFLAFIKEGLHNRLVGWSAKWLSKNEKKVLIKSFALALSTYVMLCFLLS